MKEQNFENYEVFKTEVEKLKKRHEYFFADAESLTIYKRYRDRSFIDFYLKILVMITQHNTDELTEYNTMLDKLGYNFNDIEGVFTDKVGVFY